MRIFAKSWWLPLADSPGYFLGPFSLLLIPLSEWASTPSWAPATPSRGPAAKGSFKKPNKMDVAGTPEYFTSLLIIQLRAKRNIWISKPSKRKKLSIQNIVIGSLRRSHLCVLTLVRKKGEKVLQMNLSKLRVRWVNLIFTLPKIFSTFHFFHSSLGFRFCFSFIHPLSSSIHSTIILCWVTGIFLRKNGSIKWSKEVNSLEETKSTHILWKYRPFPLHSSLCKGLDYALLARVKSDIEKEEMARKEAERQSELARKVCLSF